jgi:hypothetical protein
VAPAALCCLAPRPLLAPCGSGRPARSRRGPASPRPRTSEPRGGARRGRRGPPRPHRGAGGVQSASRWWTRAPLQRSGGARAAPTVGSARPGASEPAQPPQDRGQREPRGDGRWNPLSSPAERESRPGAGRDASWGSSDAACHSPRLHIASSKTWRGNAGEASIEVKWGGGWGASKARMNSCGGSRIQANPVINEILNQIKALCIPRGEKTEMEKVACCCRVCVNRGSNPKWRACHDCRIHSKVSGFCFKMGYDSNAGCEGWKNVHVPRKSKHILVILGQCLSCLQKNGITQF